MSSDLSEPEDMHSGARLLSHCIRSLFPLLSPSSHLWLDQPVSIAASAVFSLLCLSLAIERVLMKMAWGAGATAGLNCSLCQAGTYQTGSGEALLCD